MPALPAGCRGTFSLSSGAQTTRMCRLPYRSFTISFLKVRVQYEHSATQPVMKLLRVIYVLNEMFIGLLKGLQAGVIHSGLFNIYLSFLVALVTRLHQMSYTESWQDEGPG